MSLSGGGVAEYPAHRPRRFVEQVQILRLRLHGLVARMPGTYRYRVTEAGLRSALFFTRAYTRLLRPGLAHVMPSTPPGPSALRKAFDALETAIDRCYDDAKLAA